jgi:hypothetical protein
MRRAAARLLRAAAPHWQPAYPFSTASSSTPAVAPLLSRLHASPAGSLEEAKALRALWRHLQTPAPEPDCATCDCGEPCVDPIEDWALDGVTDAGVHMAAVAAARAAHAAAFEGLEGAAAAAGAAAPLAALASGGSDALAELPFDSAAAALLRAAHAYPRGAADAARLSLFDLGAGAGRPALAAALLRGVFHGGAAGVEASAPLHAASEAAAARARAAGALCAPLALAHGDATQHDGSWTQADVVLAHAPPGSPLLAAAASGASSLRPGSLLLTVGARLHAHGLQLTERRRLRASWGMCTLFIHRRVDDADAAAGDAHAGGVAGAHDDTTDLRYLRDAGTITRLVAALASGVAAPVAGAEAAVAAAFAARSELCARALCASGAPAHLAALLSPQRLDADATPAAALHRRAAAALALGALAAHPPAAAALVAASSPLSALVAVLCEPPAHAADASAGGASDALRAAAASALADVASADAACAAAVLAAGAAPPLRQLAASEHANAAAAARAALGALALEAPPWAQNDAAE